MLLLLTISATTHTALFAHLYESTQSNHLHSILQLNNEQYVLNDEVLENTELTMTGSAHSTFISPHGNQQIESVNTDSHLHLSSCVIIQAPSRIPSFETDGGTLTISTLSIHQQNEHAVTAPLTTSTNSLSTITIAGMELESRSLHLHSTFLINGNLSTSHISASHFRNISTILIDNDESRSYCPGSVSHAVVVATQMTHSVMPYRGGIINFHDANELLVLNSSFLHLQENIVYKSQQTSEQDMSFQKDTFCNISLADGLGGAAIFFAGEKQTLKAEKCVFENLTAEDNGNGGAICAKGHYCEVRYSTFRNCRGHSGGAIYCAAGCQFVSDNSLFYDCHSHATACQSPYSGISGEANQAETGGGAIYFIIKEKFYVTNTVIKDCTASSFGGGIFINNIENPICPENIYFQIEHSMFFNTRVLTLPDQTDTEYDKCGGHNVMFSIGQIASDESSIQQYYHDKATDIATDTEARVLPCAVRIGRLKNEGFNLPQWRDANFFVSQFGENTEECGDKTNPCLSVSYVSNRIANGKTITVENGTYNNKDQCIYIGNRTQHVVGIENENTKSLPMIELELSRMESLMIVTTGSLALEKVYLKNKMHETPNRPFDLISVTGPGSLNLERCKLEGAGWKQQSRFITIVGGSLTMTECNISNMYSTHPVGVVIFVELSSSSAIEIHSCSFDNCRSYPQKTPKAAAIHLHLDDNASNFKLSNLTFSGTDADKSRKISISTADLDKEKGALTKEKFQVACSINPDDSKNFRCESRGGTYVPQELGIPDYLGLKSEVFIGADSDTAGCGSEETPCKSLGYAKDQNGDLSGLPIFVLANAFSDGSVEVGGSSIRPKEGSGQASLGVSFASSLYITGTDTTTITRIVFQFQLSEPSPTPLFSTSAGKFHLTSCSFCSTSPSAQAPAQALISISGSGSIETDGLRIADLSFNSSLVSIVSSSITLGDVCLSNCEYTGPVSTVLLSIELAAAVEATLNVGSITFNTLTAPTASDSSKLTLAEVKGTSSTEITSEENLFNASSHTFSSNTALSFSGTSSAAVTLLTMEHGSAFTLSIFSSSIVFTPSTSVTTTSLADTTSSSLELSSSTINLDNLDGFYTTALFAVPVNALSITFASLSSPVIGNSKMSTPFAVVSGGTMTLTNISLNGNLLTSNFAHSMLKQTAGSLILNTCSFNSITTTDEGAAIQATLGTSEKLSLTGVAFTSCSSTDASKKGGAISVALTTGSFTADAGTSFAGCSAASGGAIAIDLTGRSDSGTFTLSGVTFGTPLNTATKGSDIFVLTGTGGRTYLTTARFGNSHPSNPSSGTFFESADLNKWYFVDSDSVEGSILYLLYPYKGGTLNVHSSSPANDLCGHELLPCNTLNDGNRLVQSTTTSNADDACIVLLSDVSVSAEITSSSTVEWKSDLTRRTITLSTDVGVTVNGGSLTVSDLTLTVSDLTLTVTSSPFSTSFFTLSGGSLSVKSSEFSSISSTGEASAIKAVLNEDQTLSLTGVTFTSCSTTGTLTNGGALHVTVSGGSFIASDTISFDDCTATGKGSKLYLSSSSLSSIVTTTLATLKPTSLPTTKAATDVILNDFYGYESGTSEMSLLYFWFPHTSSETSTHIHKDGANAPNCGLLQLPCLTLEEGLKRLNTANKFVIDSALRFNEALSISSPLTVTAGTNTVVTVGAEGKFTIASSTLSLSNLAFTGPASPSSSSFMTVSSGGSLSITDCSFASFSSSSNGAAIKATLAPSHTLSLTRVTFTSCHTTGTDTNGGALHITLEGGSFSIPSPSSFESCSAKGNGGAVFVDVSNQLGGSFSFRNGSFGEGGTANTCGGKGKDVFIEGGDLSSIITKALFPPAYFASPVNTNLLDSIRLSSTHTDPVMSLLQYLFSPETEGTVDETDSADNGQCGHLEVNCKTLAQLNTNSPKLSKAKVQTKLTLKQQFTPSRSLTITSVDQETKAALVLVSTPSLKVQDKTHVLTLCKLNIAMEISVVITNSGTGYVVLDVGKLEVSDSSFTSSTTMPASLITVTGSGSLDVSDFDVENVVLTNAALIEASGSGDISIKTSHFKSVTRTLTDPTNSTVLSTTLSSSSSLILNTISIDSCDTAIYLDLADSVPASTSYSVKSVTFETDDPSQLYIIGQNLVLFIDNKNWTGSYETLSNDDILFSLDTAKQTQISLIVYLIPHAGPLHVKGGQSSSSQCGSPILPCPTLEMAIFRVSDPGTCLCEGDIEIGAGELVILKEVNVTNNNVPSKLVWTGSEVLICSHYSQTGDTSIVFSSLAFECPSGGQDQIRVIVKGNVEFNHIVISCLSLTDPAIQTDPFSFATLNNVTISVPTIKTHPFSFGGRVSFVETTQNDVSSHFLAQMGGNDETELELFQLFLSQTQLSSFSSSFSTSDLNSQPPNSQHCHWTTGVIELAGTTLASHSSFSNISNGVFRLLSGQLTIEFCSFSDNFVVPSSPIPQLQQNLFCESGIVVFDVETTFSSSQSSEVISHWMSAGACEVKRGAEIIPSSRHLFVPTLPKDIKTQSVVDDLHKSGQQACLVTIEGQNFLPCNLSLSIFDISHNFSSQNAIQLPLSSESTHKSIFNFTFKPTAISFILNPGQGQFADGQYNISVVLNGEELASFSLISVQIAFSVKLRLTLLSVLIPVSLVIVALVIVIIVLCCRYNTYKNKRRDEEMVEQGLLADQSTFHQEEQTDFSDDKLTQLHLTAEDNTDSKNPLKQPIQPLIYTHAHHAVVPDLSQVSVLCVVCSGTDLNFAFADRRMTLSERIHGTEKTFEFEDAEGVVFGPGQGEKEAHVTHTTRLTTRNCVSIAMKVAKTILSLRKKGKESGVVTEFSLRSVNPLSILVYPDNTILLALPDSFVRTLNITLPLDDPSTKTRYTREETLEESRWNSPENTEQAVLNEQDCELSIVFSLALTLHEMLSEQIPFNEVDAVNAHRKLQSGLLPDLRAAIPEAIRQNLLSKDPLLRNEAEESTEARLEGILETALAKLPVDRCSLAEFETLLGDLRV
ncbi:hypothetical protein BLNAU_7713 [Blattamonas nauphoetae]|uniref:Uncharacterized protein n=1 Tax=Blattamonas nauphoetae TaxID=2049346 RepID=A0ABQ9Y0S2_9EUKA|nr:hypothetical protein BLNAU_7713 [Blattamonas nauphoetae]